MTPCSGLAVCLILGDEDKIFLRNTGDKHVCTVTIKQSVCIQRFMKSKQLHVLAVQNSHHQASCFRNMYMYCLVKMTSCQHVSTSKAGSKHAY